MALGLHLGLNSNIIGGVSGDGSMHDAVSSCVCDFTITDEGTVNNRVGSAFDGLINKVTEPDDGATQAAYNFTNGGSTGAEWTVVGDVDGATIDDYFANSGDNSLELTGAMSAVPAMAKAHRSDQAHGYGLSFTINDTSVQGTDNWLGNIEQVGHIGIRIRLSSTETIQLAQGDGSVNNFSGDLSSVLTSNKVYSIIVTWDGTNATCWLNGVKTTIAFAFNTSTVDSTDIFTIGQSMDATTKLYDFEFYNNDISDADAAAILSEYETRHPTITFD